MIVTEKPECPLCETVLDSLYHTQDHEESGYHSRCPSCGHGWYIADLQNITSMRLAGKSDEQIRSIILKKDKEVKDATR